MTKRDFTKAMIDEMKPQFHSVGMNKAYWCGMHAVLEAIRTSAAYDEIKDDQVSLTYHEICIMAQGLYNLVLDEHSI